MKPTFRTHPATRFDGGCNARSVGPCHGEVTCVQCPTGSNVTSELRLCYRHLEEFHGVIGHALLASPGGGI